MDLKDYITCFILKPPGRALTKKGCTKNILCINV